MRRRTTLAAIVSLAALPTVLVVRRAEAADRFGVVGIENATRVTVRLEHRWGDGQWAADVIPAGTRKTYWWTYQTANEDRSPPFHIRFDSDLSPGRFVERYNLRKNRSPIHEWENAHKYAFKYDGNARFVDLYEVR